MERSKGLILLVVGLAAALIVWQVGFNKPETPNPVTEKNPVTTSQPGQPAAGAASRQNSGPNERIAANPQGRNTAEANPNRTMERGDNNRIRTTQPNIQNTGYKIAIPANISTADLQIIYNEYLRFSGGRNNRTRGGNRGGMMESFGGMGGRGGMMEGGMMGGGMMGGYGGMGDMGAMMEQFGGMGDMGAMMEQFGGMGGFGGGMGMAPGGMEMGGNDQMNIDDSENNF